MKTILSSTGSQWRSLRVSVMWSPFLETSYNSSRQILNALQFNYIPFLCTKKKRITKVQLRANKTVNSNFCGTFSDVFSYFRHISYVIECTLNYCTNMSLKVTLCRQKSRQDCEPVERAWCFPCQPKSWEGDNEWQKRECRKRNSDLSLLSFNLLVVIHKLLSATHFSRRCVAATRSEVSLQLSEICIKLRVISIKVKRQAMLTNNITQWRCIPWGLGPNLWGTPQWRGRIVDEASSTFTSWVRPIQGFSFDTEPRGESSKKNFMINRIKGCRKIQ